MPQISNTPESLLPRSDSRNPATTCRGITTQGRPCRRALGPSQTVPLSRPLKGVSHVPDPESLYCWQHKDQAGSTAPWDKPITPAKPRTSIETLMDRLGVLEITDQPGPQKMHQRRTNQSLGKKRRPRPKRTLCCFEIVDDSHDDHTPSRPVQRPQSRPSQGGIPSPQNLQKPQPSAGISQRPRPSVPNGRQTSTSSQTQTLLSWIPTTLSPEVTSILLTELSKPISSADEDGYIYMFWLTPQTATTGKSGQSPLPRDIATSLIPSVPTNNHLRPPTQPRSVSDAIRAAKDLNALTSNPTSTAPGTVRLKIGRTNNVHRRMNEWTNQCDYDLTLIRYYPYTSSSSASSSPARTPPAANKRSNSHSAIDALVPGRKVQHVHRVERLIHLELGELRLRDLGKCGVCGKEHREWFEVEAAKESLRKVDECVRRWVAWGESIP
jgi:hypothetical protein